jgi:hypothetical protein
MEVKEAAVLAREYVNDVLGEDELIHLAIEEVDYDDHDDEWIITIGFYRPWSQNAGAIRTIVGDPFRHRSYKSIRIDDDTGRVLSIKERRFSQGD